MYYAIIGDIINSKQLKQRYVIQEKLKAVLNTINTQYQEDIASNFTITIGDEFQGLLKHPLHLLEIIDTIKMHMIEIDIRFGIGEGDILTLINKEISIGADGPAYWHARKAIEEVHKHHDYGSSKVQIVLATERIDSQLIKKNLTLFDYIENSWTKSQYEIYTKMVLFYGYDISMKQKEVAQSLEMSAQNMYKFLKKTGCRNLIQAKQAWCVFLNERGA